MKKTAFYLLLTFLSMFFSAFILNSQSNLNPAEKIKFQKEAGVDFEELTCKPFTATSEVLDKPAARFARNSQFLLLNEKTLAAVMAERPMSFSVSLPFNSETIILDLVAADVLTPDFKLETSESQGKPVAFKEGLHYRGTIRGDEKSLAAISFFDEEIMGLIADPRRGGNLVLGKLDIPNNRSKYIFYDDSQLAEHVPFKCGVDDNEKAEFLPGSQNVPEVNGCVRIFFETDFALFTNKGSVQNVINYVTGAFNQMAILYNTETISVQLSQVFCWTTQDAYNTTNSGTALNQFVAFRTSFNADLAHLVVIGGASTGGVAYLSGICTSGSKYAYSDINTSFSNVPTYSWTVMVLTHETGHNMSSRHTHWCGWAGGAIDNCATPEGSCNPGPAPVNGGTIMSYCHQTPGGINLANGFGPLPGAAIRNFVSTRTCLAATCTPFPTCAPPIAYTVSNITGSSAQIAWALITGSTSYTLTYRAVGNGAWTTINNATSPTTISGLPSNDEIEVTVRSNCGAANSGYRNGVIFKTGAASSCGTPTNLTMSNITSSGATAAWTAVTGATSYEISWKLNSATTWGAAVTVTAATHNITGLVANSLYNVRVRAICGANQSAYSTTNFTTSAASACNAPNGLAATASNSTTVVATWSAVTGATSYQISWKLTSSTTWGAASNIAGTSFTITGLTAATSYDVRVRATCSSGNSGYSQVTVVTPSNCGTPTNLTVGSITTTSATATWSAVSGASNYRVSWKLASASTWSAEVTVTTTSRNITGLTAASAYNIRVRASCTSGFSSYAQANFTTQAAAGCGAVTNLTVDAISANSAIATWTGVTGATLYEVSKKLSSATVWGTPANTTVTSFNVTGLLAGSIYDVRVRAKCGTVFGSYVFGQVETPANKPGSATNRNEVKTLNLEKLMLLSPNPASSLTVLSLDLPEEESVEMQMFDFYGREISRQEATFQTGAFQIDLENLPNGLYFVRVNVGGHSQTMRKLVVEN